MFTLPNVQRAREVLGPDWKYAIHREVTGITEWWVVTVDASDQAEAFCFLTIDRDGRAHVHEPVILESINVTERS